MSNTHVKNKTVRTATTTINAISYYCNYGLLVLDECTKRATLQGTGKNKSKGALGLDSPLNPKIPPPPSLHTTPFVSVCRFNSTQATTACRHTTTAPNGKQNTWNNNKNKLQEQTDQVQNSAAPFDPFRKKKHMHFLLFQATGNPPYPYPLPGHRPSTLPLLYFISSSPLPIQNHGVNHYSYRTA